MSENGEQSSENRAIRSDGVPTEAYELMLDAGNDLDLKLANNNNENGSVGGVAGDAENDDGAAIGDLMIPSGTGVVDLAGEINNGEKELNEDGGGGETAADTEGRERSDDEDDDDWSDDDDDDNVNIVISMKPPTDTSATAVAGSEAAQIIARQKAQIKPGGVVGAGSATNLLVGSALGAGGVVKVAQPPGMVAKGVDLEAPGTINDAPTYEYDLQELKDEEKPWRKPGADITDYFNYGFTEETWIAYCIKQKRQRAENNMLKATGGVAMMNMPPQQPPPIIAQPPPILAQPPPVMMPPGAGPPPGGQVVPGPGGFVPGQPHPHMSSPGTGPPGSMPPIQVSNPFNQPKLLPNPVIPQFQRFPPPSQQHSMSGPFQSQNPMLLQQQQSQQPQQQKPPHPIDHSDMALARRQLMAANASQSQESGVVVDGQMPYNMVPPSGGPGGGGGGGQSVDFSTPPPGWNQGQGGPPGGPPQGQPGLMPNMLGQQPPPPHRMPMSGLNVPPPGMNRIPPPQQFGNPGQQPPLIPQQQMPFGQPPHHGGPHFPMQVGGGGLNVPPPLHDRPPPFNFGAPPQFNPRGNPPIPSQIMPPASLGPAWEKPTTIDSQFFEPESEKRMGSPSPSKPSHSTSGPSHSYSSKDSYRSRDYPSRGTGGSSGDYHRRGGSPSSPTRRGGSSSTSSSSHRYRDYEGRRGGGRDTRDRSRDRSRDKSRDRSRDRSRSRGGERSRSRSRSREDKHRRRRKSEDDDHKSSKSHKRSKKSRKEKDSTDKETSGETREASGDVKQEPKVEVKSEKQD